MHAPAVSVVAWIVERVAPPGGGNWHGQAGELWTKGHAVLRGCWCDGVRTREAIVDGWMRTGDLAALEANGCFNTVGRRKDIVIGGVTCRDPSHGRGLVGPAPDSTTDARCLPHCAC